MKHIKLILVAVAAFILMAPACSKDDSDILPPATQTGANTFGCKINGVVYKCKGHTNANKWLATEGCSFNLYDNRVSLDAWIYKPKHKISIEFSYIEKKTGIYRENIRYYTGYPIEGSDSYVNVTRFDDKVISGTFQMDIKFSDGDIWHITDGRFDLTYYKQ